MDWTSFIMGAVGSGVLLVGGAWLKPKLQKYTVPAGEKKYNEIDAKIDADLARMQQGVREELDKNKGGQ